MPSGVYERRKKGDFMTRRSHLNSQKKRRLLRPARKIKQGEIMYLRLRNYVAQYEMVHEHMRVLGCTRRHEPWRPGRIAGIIDQQQRAVLRVLPQGLGQDKAAFLDGAVIVVG
jgi:hypothetical protein